MDVLLTGIAVADVIAADLDHIAEPGELVFTENIELRAGGHACNVSLDLRDLEVDPERMVSAISVGDDLIGKLIVESLQEREIFLRLKKSERKTSRDLVLVERGKDRRFHAMVGANLDLDATFVNSVLGRQKPDLFYVGGVGMLGLDDELNSILKNAEDEDCVTLVDPVQSHEHGWSYLLNSLPFINILHLNEEEGRALTGERSRKDILNSLLDRGVNLVLLTTGEEGAIAKTNIGIVKVPAPSPSPFGKVVDPTGAGDAFCAGIIHELLQKNSQLNPYLESLEKLEKLLRFASACGALACTTTGATGGLRVNHAREIARKG